MNEGLSHFASEAVAQLEPLVHHGWFIFCLILLAGWVAELLVSRLLRPCLVRLPEMTSLIIRKSVSALIWCLAAVQALHALGVDVMSLLGAAGVAGIAIGFASQTALSNIISGLFIMGERSIKIGDYIHTGSNEGTVESVSLLSVTLRQPDNSLLRLPCETLIKAPFSNESAVDKRRCSIEVGVEYGTDLDKLQNVVTGVVKECDFLLNEPAPTLRFNAFSDSAVSLLVCAWCPAADYYETRYRFAKALYNAFRREGISFAFPVRKTVH